MTRAARGHTGRPLTASAVTATAYLCVLLAAISRPLAEIFVDFYQPLLMLAGTAWIAAFVLFATEHAPILWLPSPASKARKGN
jgi:uncharacterized protein involved in response to NO